MYAGTFAVGMVQTSALEEMAHAAVDGIGHILRAAALEGAGHDNMVLDVVVHNGADLG